MSPLFDLKCTRCKTIVEVLSPSREVLSRQKPICLKCGNRKHEIMPSKVGRVEIK